MKGRRIAYSDLELAFVSVRRDLPRAELHSEFQRVFGRPDVSQANLTALCKRNGWTTGRTGRFQKGQEPPNKGRKGYSPPGSDKGWFRKGHEPHNTRHLGHRRVSKDGYVEVSVAETNPHTGYHRRYVQEHRWRWEKANGPVSEGHVLKCLDGDKMNTDPENWICLPRALLPRLNGRFGRDFENAPPELKPMLIEIARLEHAAREARKAKT